MTASSPDQSPVQYFCTAGNGMEPFLVDEVKRKVEAQHVIRLQGKVIFSSSANINSIINLKSAERLFLLLNHGTPLKLPANISQGSNPFPAASSLLQNKVIGDRSEFTRVAMSWMRLQGELKDRPADKCPAKPSDSKRRRLEHENPERTPVDTQPNLLTSVDPITFRVSCKCSGSVARYFSTQDVGKVLGASLTTLLGWKVDLKNPHLEVSVNLTDDYCLLGIPLTKCPLANREYIQTTGLRSTVAWAMASMAQIQPGSFVVDPMCGVGTILIEAAKEHSGAYFIGTDIDDEQLVKASGNIVYAHLEERMQVLKTSSLALPFHNASVDAVVCDMPFGRKFGTKIDAATNLPLILSEMTRVLRVGGILVLLMNPQLSSLIKRFLTQEDVKSENLQEKDLQNEKLNLKCPPGLNRTNPLSSLRHEQTVRVSLGAIDGLIHKYVKIKHTTV